MSAAELVAQLAEAGTPPQLLAAVAQELFAGEAERAALASRRQNERDRKARSRDGTGQGVTGAEVTADPSPQSPPLKAPPDPLQTTPPLTPQPERRTKAREATRLPEDWKPAKLSRDTVSGQIVENRGQEWARRALESFKNHWRSANGPNARKRDWQAAFANWIIEQDNRDGRSTKPLGRNQSADGLSATARAALAVFGPDPGDGQGIPQ